MRESVQVLQAELLAAAVPLRMLHVLGEPAASVPTGWRWTAGGVTHGSSFLVMRFASRQGPLVALDGKWGRSKH